MRWLRKQWAHQLGLCWLHPHLHLVSESSWRGHQRQLSVRRVVLKCHLGGIQELEEKGQILPKQTNIKTFISSNIRPVFKFDQLSSTEFYEFINPPISEKRVKRGSRIISFFP